MLWIVGIFHSIRKHFKWMELLKWKIIFICYETTNTSLQPWHRKIFAFVFILLDDWFYLKHTLQSSTDVVPILLIRFVQFLCISNLCKLIGKWKLISLTLSFSWKAHTLAACKNKVLWTCAIQSGKLVSTYVKRCLLLICKKM